MSANFFNKTVYFRGIILFGFGLFALITNSYLNIVDKWAASESRTYEPFGIFLREEAIFGFFYIGTLEIYLLVLCIIIFSNFRSLNRWDLILALYLLFMSALLLIRYFSYL